MPFDPRYHESPRKRQATLNAIALWKGKKTEACLDAIETWDWMCKRAEEEGLILQDVPTTTGHIRLSITYIKLALDDETDNVKPNELKQLSNSNYAEFLSWSDSKLGKFCLRLEEVIEKGRIRAAFRKVRRQLEKNIDAGDKKSIELWFRINGKYDGQDDPVGSDPVEVVESYVDTAEGVIENKKVLQLPVEGKKPRTHGNTKPLEEIQIEDLPEVMNDQT